MEAAADAVTLVVQHRGERFADADAVVAVAAPPRQAGDRRGAYQPLAIDDVVEAARADGAEAGSDLAERRRRVKRAAPAPPGDGNDLIDGRIQPHQGRESLLAQPRQPRLGPRPARLGHRRHVMDHIAERRGLDEKNVGHRAFRALIYRSDAATATAISNSLRLLAESRGG